MSPYLDFLPPALLRATLWLAAAAVVVRLALWLSGAHSPRLHRLAWACVLAQGVIVAQFSLEIPWYEHPPGSGGVLAPTDLAAVPAEQAGSNPQGAQAADWLTGARRRMERLPDFMQLAGLQLGSTAATRAIEDPAPASPASGGRIWTASRVVTAIWLGGMATLIGFTLVSYGLLLSRLRRGRAAPIRWQREWRAVLQDHGVRRRIPLLVHSRLGPMLCQTPRGFCVVVPRVLWSHFTRAQRVAVLRHEVAHYQRGDVWKSLLVRIFSLPHWFNPCAWWAVRKFEETGEWACDQCLAEHDPRGVPDLARALLRIVEPSSRQVCASCAGGAPLAVRLRRLLAIQIPEDSLMKRVLVLTVLCGLLAIGALRLHLVAKEPSDSGSLPGAAGQDAVRAEETPEQVDSNAGTQGNATADADVGAARMAAAPRSLDNRIEELADQVQAGDSEILTRFQQVLRTPAGQLVLHGRAGYYETVLRDEARDDALPAYLAEHFEKSGGRYVLQPGAEAEAYRSQLLTATAAFNEDVQRMSPVLQEVADNFVGDSDLDRLIIRFLRHEAAAAMLYVQGLHKQLRPDETVVQEQLGELFVANEEKQFAIRGSGRIEAEERLRDVQRMVRGLKPLRIELQNMSDEFASLDDLHRDFKQALQEPMFVAYAANQSLAAEDDAPNSERIEAYFVELDQLAQDMGDGLQIVNDEQRQAVTNRLTEYRRARTLAEKLREPLRAFAARIMPGDKLRDGWRGALETDVMAMRMATDIGGVSDDPAVAARALLGDSLQRDDDGKYRVRAEAPEAVGEFVREMLRMYRNVRRKGLDVDELAEQLEDPQLRTAFTSLGGKFVLVQAVEKQLTTQYFDGLGRWIEEHFERTDEGLVMREGTENELTSIADEAAEVEKELGKDDF